jgi:hypothetical protein
MAVRALITLQWEAAINNVKHRSNTINLSLPTPCWQQTLLNCRDSSDCSAAKLTRQQ